MLCSSGGIALIASSSSGVNGLTSSYHPSIRILPSSSWSVSSILTSRQAGFSTTAALAESDHRPIFIVEAAELPDRRISIQSFLVLTDELGKVGTPDLLLAFDHPLDVAGNISPCFQESVNRDETGYDVSLVVARSPSMNSTVFQGR